MVPLRELAPGISSKLLEWLRLRWTDLRFAELPTSLLVMAVLVAISLLMLLAGGLRSRRAGRTHLALPALVPVIRGSSLSAARHAAFVLFLLGVPLFAVALADPRMTVVGEKTSYPGRRIAILIDGSGSMVMPFDAPKLAPKLNRTFFVAVAAAEEFLKLRMASAHNDLIALVQFGNEAYVVTPFTTDYENVLLSATLIGSPTSWNQFNMFGTTIIQGIDQGLELFKTFDLLKTSGNLMILITDGNDGETMFRGRSLDSIMAEAARREIPIYMVRVGFNKPLGAVPWDSLWKPAVERTGGRFYAAPDEKSVIAAVTDIERQATGRIDVQRYGSAEPRYSGFALAAVMIWVAAGTLKLGFRSFRTFP